VFFREGSIEHFVLGSMLAVALRSIACFASLEYRFAVEEGGGRSLRFAEDRVMCYVLR